MSTPYDYDKWPHLNSAKILDAISALGDLEVAIFRRDEADWECRAAEEKLIEACGGKQVGVDSIGDAMWTLPGLEDGDPLYRPSAAEECRLLLAPWLSRASDTPAAPEAAE